MSPDHANPSKHTPGDTSFLDSLPAWQLMAFRNHIYNPGYRTSNANRFLDYEWIDVPSVKIFLAENASGTPPIASATRQPADQELVYGLSARQVIEFRSFMHPGRYISGNAVRFLDLNWIDVLALRDFLAQSGSSLITSQSSVSSDPVRFKIEPPHASESITPAISIKSEPPSTHLSSTSGAVKLRTLHEGGQEIFELIDSEAENSDTDSVEVTAALMRPSSRSSSVHPPTDIMDTDHQNIDDAGTPISIVHVPLFYPVSDHQVQKLTTPLDSNSLNTGDDHNLSDDDAHDLVQSDKTCLRFAPA
ncbi:hypothetical protein B0H19DRAFT_1266719 [Mycena capillaripes]|nr:hypothetical protein B0H19DRAFT_1266719 [Mycena capillaripes]